MAIAKNAGYHARTKHFDVRYYYIRHQISVGRIYVEYVHTSEMKADGFTKPLAATQQKAFQRQLNLKGLSS